MAALLELFPLMDPLHRLLPFDVGGNPAVIKVAFDEGLSVPSNKVGSNWKVRILILTKRNLLVLGEHLPGGKAHDAAPDRGEHAELEAGEGDGRGPQARGHEQGGGDGHLAGVLSTLSCYVLFLNLFSE